MSNAAFALREQLVMDLWEARQSGQTMEPPPAEMSALSISDSVYVQRRVMHLCGETASYFKTELSPTGQAVVAPILDSTVVESGGQLAIPRCGIILAEVELAFRLGDELTAEIARRGTDTVLSIVDSIFVGVELIGPRIANHRSAPYPAYLADNLGNAAYVVQLVHPWQRALDLDAVAASLAFNGELIASATAHHVLGLTTALERYACSADAGDPALRAGQTITTGKLCAPIPLPGRGQVAVRLDNVEVTFELV